MNAYLLLNYSAKNNRLPQQIVFGGLILQSEGS